MRAGGAIYDAVIVRNLDDDAATIIMVDSNIQRESLLPSERAFAYRMKLEALKRQAGRPSKENCDQLGHNSIGKRTVDIIAETSPDSRNQIQRFIRLTELIPELLDMVDNRKIAFNPAVELSYLKSHEQTMLLDAMDSEQATPRFRSAAAQTILTDGKLTEESMLAIMSEEKSDLDRVTLNTTTLRKYFPNPTPPAENGASNPQTAGKLEPQTTTGDRQMKKTQFHSKRSEQSVVFDSPAQYHAVSLSGGKRFNMYAVDDD